MLSSLVQPRHLQIRELKVQKGLVELISPQNFVLMLQSPETFIHIYSEKTFSEKTLQSPETFIQQTYEPMTPLQLQF